MKEFVRKQCETMHIRWLLRRDHDWAAIAVALDVYAEERRWTCDPVALLEIRGEWCLVEIDDVIEHWDIIEYYDAFAHNTGPAEARAERSRYTRFLAEGFIKDVYQDLSWQSPSFSWFPSPRAAARFVRRTCEADVGVRSQRQAGRRRRRVEPKNLHVLMLDQLRIEGMETDGTPAGRRRRHLVADAVADVIYPNPIYSVPLPIELHGTHDVDVLSPVAERMRLRRHGLPPPGAPRGSTDLIYWAGLPSWVERLTIASALLGWWWPMDRMVVASDLPVIDGLTQEGPDAQFMLEYRDGWRVYVDDDGQFTPPPRDEPMRWGR